VLAQVWRRRSQRAGNDSRVLAVHLFQHEDGTECDDENVVRALHEHLRWSERKAERVVARSLRLGLVLRDGVKLDLTAKGRQLALELLEPWRAGT
jgi:manganese/zinc/iron transport system permease protein